MAVRVFVVSCFLVKVSSLNVNYNLGHNILELYSVLIQTRFTTSKTKLDIQYSKLDIRVASRVAERLKIQDLKTQENLKFGWRHSPAPSPPQKLNSRSNSQKTRQSGYQTLPSMSSFTGLVHSAPNILPRIVGLI